MNGDIQSNPVYLTLPEDRKGIKSGSSERSIMAAQHRWDTDVSRSTCHFLDSPGWFCS